MSMGPDDFTSRQVPKGDLADASKPSEPPGIIRKKPALPTGSAARKAVPLWSGVFMYFPDALAAVAELSRAGNDKHNPGQPLHWSRGKSNDHADCVARHLIDIGPEWTDVDEEDNILHAIKLAWRALAVAQIAIERRRERQPAE